MVNTIPKNHQPILENDHRDGPCMLRNDLIAFQELNILLCRINVVILDHLYSLYNGTCERKPLMRFLFKDDLDQIVCIGHNMLCE